MAYALGALIGALLITLLVSRVTLWACKRLGDNQRRIFIAHAIAFALAVTLGGLGYADGGPPRFLYAATLYVVPTLLWLAMDLFALKRRRTKGQNSN
jgi:predicted MFS family arabinose efflux permease